jgi:hypothetical protein
METELFGVILGAMGAVASLIMLLFFLKQHASWQITVSLAIIILLTGTSSFFSYQYYQISKREIVEQRQRELMQATIRSFEYTFSTPPYSDAPGRNKGIVKSGLIILEMNKNLFPETYVKIKSDIEKDIAYTQQYRDKYKQRPVMQKAAESIYFILKALSGKTYKP